MAESATFIIGPRDTIEDVNDAAAELTGYARAELVGMHGSELIPLDRQTRTAVSLDRMRLGSVVLREGVMKHKDGTVLSVMVEARVLGGNRLALEVRRWTSGDPDEQ